VEKLALALLDREVLHQQDVEDLLGKRPFEEKKIFSETDSNPQPSGNGELDKSTELNTQNPSSVETSNN
jgi:cell division protease FtsH